MNDINLMNVNLKRLKDMQKQVPNITSLKQARCLKSLTQDAYLCHDDKQGYYMSKTSKDLVYGFGESSLSFIECKKQYPNDIFIQQDLLTSIYEVIQNIEYRSKLWLLMDI